jgi:hypothetical protein
MSAHIPLASGDPGRNAGVTDLDKDLRVRVEGEERAVDLMIAPPAPNSEDAIKNGPDSSGKTPQDQSE